MSRYRRSKLKGSRLTSNRLWVKGAAGGNNTEESASPLLDTYTGAAAAYSLRKLRTAYSGSAVRIREAGGDTELDVGFDANGDFDTASAESHCGANDGFVTKWYDQHDGTAVDMSQATAASQPKIVSSGSVITDATSGLPIIEFSDASWVLTSSLSLSQPDTVFIVTRWNEAGKWQVFDSTDTDRQIIRLDVSGEYGAFAGLYITGGTNDGNLHVIDALYNGASSDMFVDNVETATGNASTKNMGAMKIGGSAVGDLHELIAYDSDTGANRSGIRTNMNDYYSAY